jgi:hypothetical protein
MKPSLPLSTAIAGGAFWFVFSAFCSPVLAQPLESQTEIIIPVTPAVASAGDGIIIPVPAPESGIEEVDSSTLSSAPQRITTPSIETTPARLLPPPRSLTPQPSLPPKSFETEAIQAKVSEPVLIQTKSVEILVPTPEEAEPESNDTKISRGWIPSPPAPVTPAPTEVESTPGEVPAAPTTLPLPEVNGLPPLPVPGAKIPLGNPGSDRSVIAREENLPPPPNTSLLVGSRFRVVVDIASAGQQAQIRALIPDAFRSTYQGRSVIQVGAFKERSEADNVIQVMTSNGFEPVVELVQ